MGQTQQRRNSLWIGVVGGILAVGATVHSILVVPNDLSFVSQVLLTVAFVGAPLGLPWVIWTFLEVLAPRGPTVIEGGYCVALLLCEVWSLIRLPEFLLATEGFGLLYVWAFSAAATLVLVAVTFYGRRLARQVETER
jgi:uncharacterized membrane protein